jgi:hypothetical protein
MAGVHYRIPRGVKHASLEFLLALPDLRYLSVQGPVTDDSAVNKIESLDLTRQTTGGTWILDPCITAPHSGGRALIKRIRTSARRHHSNFVHCPSDTTSTQPSTTLMAVCSSMA